MVRNMKNIKNKISLRKSDDGVAGIIVAILMVGLFISVLVMVQTQYVPNWMMQKEAEHMETVANQFAQLKFAIDTQSIIGSNFEDSEIDIPPITTSITLGSKEDPIFASSRAFGSLELLDNSFSISITNATNENINKSLGTIKYSSENAYFLDQSFIYEAGALIIEQPKGNVMSIKPPLKGDIAFRDLTLTLCNISYETGRASVSGYGTYPILTEFSKLNSYELNETKNININTKYANSWKIYLKNALAEGYIEDGIDYTISVEGNNVKLKFINDDDYNFNLKIVDIIVEIAPGWTE